MTPVLFDDNDVRRLLDADTAVRAVRSAVLAHHEGTLSAPPRVRADVGPGHLVFTAGHLSAQHLFGFRAYDTFAGAEQLVAVWGSEDGALRALVHGGELGARRTGAIGAVAADVLAPPGPVRVAVVGAGTQAWTQLWAIRAVRPVDEAVVVSRRPARAESFALRAAEELGVRARTAATVEEAVRGREVVITATDSSVPVLRAEWIALGAHVATVGPKTTARHEVPAELADRAALIVTDSPAQAHAYPEPHVFGTRPMSGLGAVLAGEAPGRTTPDQVTVFCSVGLAGTEVAVAGALWEAARGK